MRASEILNEMRIDCICQNEQEFSSLGLVGYNNGSDVCIFLENIKYIQEFDKSISMILTTKEIGKDLCRINPNIGICIVDEPRIVFFAMHNFLANNEKYLTKREPTIIGKNCKISTLANISKYNVVIGNNVIIEEFCSIKNNTKIGDNSIIRTGTVIGSEGFEFKRSNGAIFGVKHVGGVEIGRDVEIQANCCIDKAIYPWDNTIIGKYSKVDNLVHVGHGVKIGDRSMIVTHSAVGGRTHIGNDSWIGIGVIIRNGLELGNNIRANMGAVVTKDVCDNETVTGNFAINHDKFIADLKKREK